MTCFLVCEIFTTYIESTTYSIILVLAFLLTHYALFRVDAARLRLGRAFRTAPVPRQTKPSLNMLAMCLSIVCMLGSSLAGASRAARPLGRICRQDSLDSGGNSRVYALCVTEVVHIGKAAKLGGVSVDTIRFYQKLGLVKSASRSTGGYRLFDGEQIRDLKFVRHAQKLGFSLTEVKELLALRTKHHACSEVQSMLKRKLGNVREKIKSLARLERDRRRRYQTKRWNPDGTTQDLTQPEDKKAKPNASYRGQGLEIKEKFLHFRSREKNVLDIPSYRSGVYTQNHRSGVNEFNGGFSPNPAT